MTKNNAAMIGGMTSSCGVRAAWNRVVRAVWAGVVRKPAPAACEGRPRAGRRSVVSARVAIGPPRVGGGIERRRCVCPGRDFGVAAGESEECLVERGTAQADVVDFEAALDKEPERIRQLLGSPVGSN